MAAEIRIEGLDSLIRVLDELPARIEKNVLRGAMRAAANVVADDARKRLDAGGHGDNPGALRDSVRVGSGARNGVVSGYVKAGDGKTQAFYGLMVELGTKAHWIKPKNRKSLFFAGLAREAVHHPGAQPHAFLRPALDANVRQGVEAMRAYIEDRLPKELAKLRSEVGT